MVLKKERKKRKKPKTLRVREGQVFGRPLSFVSRELGLSDLTFKRTALAIGECSGGGREWERGAPWEAMAITQGDDSLGQVVTMDMEKRP